MKKEELKTERTASKNAKKQYIEFFTGISFRGFEMWCRNNGYKPYKPESLKAWLEKRKKIIFN